MEYEVNTNNPVLRLDEGASLNTFAKNHCLRLGRFVLVYIVIVYKYVVHGNVDFMSLISMIQSTFQYNLLLYNVSDYSIDYGTRIDCKSTIVP